MNTKIKELSAFIECSEGRTPTVKTLKQYIEILREFGYTHLYLGLTDAFKICGEPYFNFERGGYTLDQLREIDAYAEEKGIELRAGIQALGHLGAVNKNTSYQDLFDTYGTLMVGKEEVYQFLDKIFATTASGIKSRVIHIGMDDVYTLGLGRYLREHGYTDKKTLFFTHLQRVVEISKKYGYTCEVWSDAFRKFIQEESVDNVQEMLPEGVRIVHYEGLKQTESEFRNKLAMSQSICERVTVAGCAWRCFGLAPDNRYSIHVAEQQLKACAQLGVEHYMLMLRDNQSNAGSHCSIFAVLPTVYATAEMAAGKKFEDIDRKKFKQILGVEFDDFMLLDNLNNPFFKELPERNARCRWGLWSDLFLGSYDLYLDEHTNEAYENLEKCYAKVEPGNYKQLFKLYQLYAKVLSVKMNLGVQIRTAYRERNKELLRKYAEDNIPQLILYMKQFIEDYEDYWLNENMAFGIEVHHLFYGGLITRWEYVAGRLLQYLEDDQAIAEMERPELLPSIIPPVDEDSCMETDYHYLITRCEI